MITSKTQNWSSVIRGESPVTRWVTLVTLRMMPMTTLVLIVTTLGSPETQKVLPVTKPDSPLTQIESPVTMLDYPVVRIDSRVSRKETVVAQRISLVSQKENVGFNEDIPRAAKTGGFPGFSLDEDPNLGLNTANFGETEGPVENKLGQLSEML